DESWIKYKCRSLYYHIINRLSDVEHLQQCDGFGVIDSKIMRNFLRSAVQDPYYDLRHWMMQYGCNIKLIPYHQRKREHGKSSYNLSKSLDFAITSLCNTSTKPLR